MRDVFHKHIRSARADPVLQAALDANAERRKNARLQALADLPVETDILRRKAHAIRSQTIQNLDLYLNQFIQKSTANGFILHQASDAEQAIRIVLEIAQTHAVKRIAKSKTMISEEIGLNEALEQAGFRPIETDLGEFIVQLRKERPAHLITPAVHLQRHQIA